MILRRPELNRPLNPLYPERYHQPFLQDLENGAVQFISDLNQSLLQLCQLTRSERRASYQLLKNYVNASNWSEDAESPPV